MDQQLKGFIRLLIELSDNLYSPFPSGWVRGRPTFDLHPRDFLDFASQLVGQDTPESRITCVSHLKRAIECQVDWLLHVLGLLDHFRKTGLGLDKKLDFLKRVGLYRGESLARLNNLRNRLEHLYEIPGSLDTRVYFDLVAAFVGSLEATAMLLGCFDDIEVDLGTSGDFIMYRLDRETRTLSVQWKTNGAVGELAYGIESYEQFAMLFSTAWLLLQLNACLGADRFRSRLSELLRQQDT